MNADIVIVGSGVAAAAVASRILHADATASILMLETGSKLKMRDFAIYQDYLITGQEPYRAYWDLPFPERDQPGENEQGDGNLVTLNGARTMMYGGTTAHWGGWAFRLKPEDFRRRQLTGSGFNWPISYEDLEEYYGQAEEYIGVSGDSMDKTTPRTSPYPYKAFPFTLEDSLHIEAFKKLGIHYSALPIARRGVGPTITSHAPCQTTGTCKYCPFGARYVAANALDDLANLESHPNFHIRLGIAVERIVMQSKAEAGALECFDRRTGRSERIEARTIIVACGGIESPKLLQRSSSDDWKDGLGNAGGWVGKGLVTHPYFFFETTLRENPLHLQPEMGFPTLVSRHYDSEAEQELGKFVLVNPPTSPVVDLARLMRSGKSADEIMKAVSGPIVVQTQGMVEVFPDKHNQVSNARGRNRFGLPQTRVDYVPDGRFNVRMNYIQSKVAEIHIAMGGGPTTMKATSWRADHAACTTRMSQDPGEGVVDLNLRVHGTENVYVCSNASFSTLGSVNPTLTLTALALRLGDHLLAGRGQVRGEAKVFLSALEESARQHFLQHL